MRLIIFKVRKKHKNVCTSAFQNASNSALTCSKYIHIRVCEFVSILENVGNAECGSEIMLTFDALSKSANFFFNWGLSNQRPLPLKIFENPCKAEISCHIFNIWGSERCALVQGFQIWCLNFD